MPRSTPHPKNSPSQRRMPESFHGGDAARVSRIPAIPPPPLEMRAQSEASPAEIDHPAPRNEIASRAMTSPIIGQDRGRMALEAPTTSIVTLSNPRLRALSVYALPFAPAVVVLLRERRNAFVRLHAARALAFYGFIGIAQIVLFVALVLIGGFASDSVAAFAFGLLFYGLFGLLGVAAVVFWLRLLADAAAGTLTSVPLLTSAAWRIEWAFARLQRLPG